VGASPIEAVKAESMLNGKDFSEELINEVARTASRECHPVPNHNYSAKYIRENINALVMEACMNVREFAQQGGNN